MTVPVRLGRRLARRLFTLGVVTAPAVAVLLATPVAPVAPAAASSSSCVGVIVDARLLGGSLRTACAPGDPRTGLAALTGIGVSYAFVPRFPGLVCSLGGQPDCTRTSASTYWSYWHRAAGSTHWVYAAEGAGSHDPAPGSTEGWVWQDGGRLPPPGIAFSTLCPTCGTPSPPPPSPPSPHGSASRPPSSQSSTPRLSATRAAAASPADASATRAAADAPSTSTAPTRFAAGTATPTVITSSAAPRPAASTGAPTATSHGLRRWTGTAAGAGVIAVLAGAALRRTRLRRRAR